MFFVRYALLHLQDLVSVRVSLGKEIRTFAHACLIGADDLAETFAVLVQKDAELGS